MKILLMLAALIFLGVASCKSTERPEDLIAQATSYLLEGYEQLGKADQELLDNKGKPAQKHIKKALKAFDHAAGYLARVELPGDSQPALSNLDEGRAALERSVKAYEAEDLGQAQSAYREAQQYLEGARSVLGT